jgi:NodT family efflux transporter outer membrane factor (OMF) lipoprotein
MRESLRIHLPLALACAALLAGCAAGPDFTRPAVPEPPARFAHADALPADPTLLWQGLGDDQLSALMRRALAGNHDLGAALARLDGAQALRRQGELDAWPVVTAQARAAQQHASVSEAAGGPRSQRQFSAGIQAGWELDLFGRLRRSTEAQQADVQASAADLQALQVAVAAQVAAAYTDLRSGQQQLQLARQQADNQHATLRLARVRLGAGSATALEAARASAQWQAAQARLPALQARVAVAQHRLAVLLGLPPQALLAELDALRPLPALPPAVDPGTPADLLRRRPDVAAAEARLHAATARVGVATADLFPRLSRGGLLASVAPGAGALWEAGSASRSVWLGVDWSFLDVGRVRARIAASEAGAAAALAQYQQTVLQALEDTENALVQLQRTREEDALLQQAAAERAAAERLAWRRYEAGSAALGEVLDTQRDLLAVQDAAADSRRRALQAAVALYQALAGGWAGQAASS